MYQEMMESSKKGVIHLDEIWQKQSYASINGVITAPSLDAGKVIDFEWCSINDL